MKTFNSSWFISLFITVYTQGIKWHCLPGTQSLVALRWPFNTLLGVGWPQCYLSLGCRRLRSPFSAVPIHVVVREWGDLCSAESVCICTGITSVSKQENKDKTPTSTEDSARGGNPGCDAGVETMRKCIWKKSNISCVNVIRWWAKKTKTY